MFLSSPKEEKQFEELYALYHHTMLQVAKGILKDEHLAEDAVQEAFIRIGKNIAKISRVNCPQTRAFAVIIVRNVALTILNDQHKQIFTDNIDTLEFVESNMEDSLLQKMDYDAILAAIEKLPDAHRDVLYLHYVQGYKTVEIGKLLGLDREAVKKRLQRGKRKLLELLPWEI